MNGLNDLSDSEVDSLVAKGRELAADYVARQTLFAHGRIASAKATGTPIVVWVGHSRSGKDEGAQTFCAGTFLKYGGSCSFAVAPVMAAALGKTKEEVYERRHEASMFWFRFCNTFRRKDPLGVVMLNLSLGDCVVGIRSGVEVEAIRAMEHVGPIVWVERKGIPKDPTLEITEDECDLSVRNFGSLDEYRQKILRLRRFLWRASSNQRLI